MIPAQRLVLALIVLAGLSRLPLSSATAQSAAGGCSTPPVSGPADVVTANGVVRGEPDGGVIAFKGIPYAAPPIGDLRWRPPAPAACWQGVRAADAFGLVCPQLDSGGAVIGDEDCLTLNVWTPDLTPSASGPPPVLVFVPGGGFVQGGGSDSLYDGSALAANGDVVVTVNYRLGALGFLATPSLSTENGGSSGNYGLLDQLAALRWVQANIADFGGDPARVAIVGQSAGGGAVASLVASPLGAGLFSAAIVESGDFTEHSLADAEQTGLEFATAAGCPNGDSACLRGLPVQTVVTALPTSADLLDPAFGTFAPTIDGYVLPDSVDNVFSSGVATAVPLIVGANADETESLIPADPLGEGAYHALLQRLYGRDLGSAVATQYPASAFASPRAALVAATTDAMYVCPSRRLARAAATGGQAPIYRYFFTHSLDRAPEHGAFHGVELAFLFESFAALRGYQPTGAEAALAGAIQAYWSNLAATGDPNAAGLVPWPLYDPQVDSSLQLDATIQADAGVHAAACDFWDASGR